MRTSFGNIRWILPLVVVVVIVLATGGFFLLRKEEVPAPDPFKAPVKPQLRQMANRPAPKENPKPKPTYASDAPLMEQARKAMREGIDPAGAVAMAENLPEKPERADAAFLLLDFAAESGHMGAALRIGRYYDPVEKSPSGSIQKDPGLAYEYYQTAATGGQSQAVTLLAGLRQWAEEQAAAGSAEARTLLAKFKK